MMNVRKLAPAVAVFVVSLAVAGEHATDSLDDVKAKVATGKAVLLDVREASEWNHGHLSNAVHAPLSKLAQWSKEGSLKAELTKRLGDLPEDGIVYCHCASGHRVLLAGDIVKNLKLDFRPLKQGYKKLVESGFPEAKPTDSKK